AQSDDILYEIFCSRTVQYDAIANTVQIENSAFKFRHSNLKQFLLDFSVIEVHSMRELNKYIIANRYRNLIERLILPEMKRRISVEEFKEVLAKQQQYG